MREMILAVVCFAFWAACTRTVFALKETGERHTFRCKALSAAQTAFAVLAGYFLASIFIP